MAAYRTTLTAPSPITVTLRRSACRRLGYRKASSAAAAILLLAFLAGCTTSSPPPPTGPSRDQDLKLTWFTGGGSADIPTYDPRISYDSASAPIVNLIYDPLVTLDKSLNVVPWAAKSWTISPDGTTYTFTLQPNQKFSDGTPLTATDYAKTVDSEFNPCALFFTQGTSSLMLDSNTSGIVGSAAFGAEKCANGKVSGSVQTLIGTSIIADDSANTLTIKLTKPAGYFLNSMTLPFSMAIEPSCYSSLADLGFSGVWANLLIQGANGQCGSGMFYVSVNTNKGLLILKPNRNWWGDSQGKKPNFTSVEFHMFENSDTFYQTYQSPKPTRSPTASPPPTSLRPRASPTITRSPKRPSRRSA